MILRLLIIFVFYKWNNSHKLNHIFQDFLYCEDVKQKELRWCQKTWVQEIMVPKHELLKSISMHIQGLNYGKGIY
jgi:hypothetical protein